MNQLPLVVHYEVFRDEPLGFKPHQGNFAFSTFLNTPLSRFSTLNRIRF